MDTLSEQTVDIEESLVKAHIPDLSHKERKRVQAHLAFVLTKLKEPNSFIEPVKNALSQMASRRQWYEKPVGLVFIAVVGAVIAAAIIFKFGWNK